MLEVKKNITITGRSVVNGIEVAGYQATINSENPENLNMSNWQVKKDIYKLNRELCRKDQADFEDVVYAIQDEMLGMNTEMPDENNDTATVVQDDIPDIDAEAEEG